MTFLIRPRIKSGESFSSWRQRGGLANGFRWFPTSAGRCAARDPDLLPAGSEIDWLIREFDVSPSDLRQASLDQYAVTLAGGRTSTPLARWILPWARHSSRNRATSGFCPICLKRDETPFFRLVWRLAFVTHCPEHRCKLVEHCPTCSSYVWPTAFSERARYAPKGMGLALCMACGNPLGLAEAIVDGREEVSAILWNALATGVPPQSAPRGIPLQDYYSVLWSVSRLVRKNIELLRKNLPSSFHLEPALSIRRNVVLEGLPATSRQIILSVASWLLEEWPTRLISICRSSGISGQAFGCKEVQTPRWFDEEIREHLFQRTNWIMREHVQTAISELRAGDLPISKNALRRKLGVTESWAINELLDQRRSASVEELATMCRQYYVILENTPPSRDQQRTLTRDFLILLLSAFSGKSIEAVCNMDQDDIEIVLRAAQSRIDAETEPDVRFLVECLTELDDQYRHGIRPDLRFRGQDIPNTWFLSRFGKKMDGHSVRSRITQLMKSTLDPKLWSSADTFGTTLVSNRTQNGDVSREAP
jgi:hypothetical protein